MLSNLEPFSLCGNHFILTKGLIMSNEKFESDIFEPDISFDVCEASGDVDGVHILGKLSGQFFVPEGKSRNKRYYTKKLWENSIGTQDVQSRLKERRMFATISHTQPLDDTALLEGKISHIITNLNPVNGFGEALILNTPAGRILNTVARAGSKLFVSSRATGQFKGERDGMPMVDENNYTLKTFDIVLEPGFLQANPSLVESMNTVFGEESPNSESNKGVHVMDKLVETLTKERVQLSEDLSKSFNENTILRNKITEITSQNESLKDEMIDYKRNESILEEYKKLGSTGEIERLITIVEGVSKNKEELAKLGTIEELTKALDMTSKFFEECGSPEAIREALNKSTKFFEEVGSPEEITAALENTKSLFEECGAPAQIKKALTESIKSFEKLGSPAQIEEALTHFQGMINSVNEAKSAKALTELAAKFNTTEDVIKTMKGKGLNESDIAEVFSSVKPAPAPVAPTAKYRKVGGDVNESKPIETDASSPFAKHSASRLMESFK